MQKHDQFVTGSTIKKIFSVSSSTLRKWDEEQKIKTVRTPGGHRLYSSNDVQKLFGAPTASSAPTIETRKKIIYARVSSNHQKEDLQRQINMLQKHYPDHELISDIGSGLNYNRKGFQRLLERIYDGNVEELVVTHRDRLCRYGFELVQFLMEKSKTKIVVHSQDYDPNEEGGATRELADDLLAVCNFFVARNNGKRAAENRKKRAKESQEKGEGGNENTGRIPKKPRTIEQQQEGEEIEA